MEGRPGNGKEVKYTAGEYTELGRKEVVDAFVFLQVFLFVFDFITTLF